jgi:hypothetical protein
MCKSVLPSILTPAQTITEPPRNYRVQLHCSRHNVWHFNVSQSVISRLWNRFQHTGNVAERPRSGHPRKMTVCQDRYLSNMAKQQRFQSAVRLNSDFRTATGVRVSSQTVRNRLHTANLRAYVETLCFWPCISIHLCNHLQMKCTGLQVTLLYCKHMEENMEKTNGQNCIHIFFGSNSKIWSLTFFVQYKLAGLIGSLIDWNFIFIDVSIWVSSLVIWDTEQRASSGQEPMWIGNCVTGLLFFLQMSHVSV